MISARFNSDNTGAMWFILLAFLPETRETILSASFTLGSERYLHQLDSNEEGQGASGGDRQPQDLRAARARSRGARQAMESDSDEAPDVPSHRARKLPFSEFLEAKD